MFLSSVFIHALLAMSAVTGTDSRSRKECLQKLRANVAFIVDASDTTDRFTFEFYIKDYMDHLVRKFQIGENNVRVTVLLYSERLFLAINGSRVQTLTNLLKAIRQLPHLGGPSDSTNLDGAITGGLSVAFPITRNKPSNEVLSVVILLSTGRLSSNAKLIKNRNGKVYATPHLQLMQRILNHYPTLGLGKSQQEVEERRLRDLGMLLGNTANYVFSIGLKGASEAGVRLLANGDEAHTLLIDNDQGYGILSVDMFDPSLIICPNPNPMPYQSTSQSSALLKTSSQLLTGPQSVHDSLLPTSRNDANQLAQLIHVQLVSDEDKPGVGQINRTRRRRRPIEHLYSVHSRPSRLLNEPLDRSGTASEPTWKGQWALGALSPWFSSAGQYVLQHIPVPLSSGIVQRPEWAARNPIYASGSKLIWAKVPQRSFDAVSPNLKNFHSGTENNDRPPRSVANAASSIHPLNSNAVDHVNHNTEGPSDVGSSSIRNTLAFSTFTRLGNNESKHGINETTWTRNNFLSWQDSATHGGGILMLAIRAGSGIRYRHIYDRTKPYHIDREVLFVNRQFYSWTPGMYDRVLFELWTSGQPQVRLVFDGQYTSNFGWFQKVLLRESYPWPKFEVVNSTMLYSSITTPFAVMQHSSKDTDASKSSSLFCSEIKAYLLIFDSDSPLSACYRTRGSWYPTFLYGTPYTDISPISNENSRDSQWSIHQADELRIYAIPYNLWDQSHSSEPKLAPYPLLLALDSRLGVSFHHLWYDRVVSPPGYQPIRFGNDTSRIGYACWFRSPVLEHWIRPYYPANIRDSFIGFPSLRVEFQNDQGQNIGILIFDCRGSPADRWFTPESLTYAWPWRTDELRRYVFVQFGVIRNLPWSTYNANEENNWSQIDLWIGKITKSRGNQSAIHTCTSFVLLMNTSAEHYRRLPSCSLGLEDVKPMNNRVFMGVSRAEAMASQMIRVHRVIIWSR